MTLTGSLIDDEHKAFIRRFLGASAIASNRSDEAVDQTVRASSVHIDALVATDDGLREIKDRLAQFLPFLTRRIIHLEDPDSKAIAHIAKELCHSRGLRDVELVSAETLSGRDDLASGVSVVVAGVVASGRELLNVSRQLRQLTANGGDVAYFIGCLKPAGRELWRVTQSSLTYKSLPNGGRGNYRLEHVWYLETEPHAEQSQPWVSERRALIGLHEWLLDTEPGPARAAIGDRLIALSAPLSSNDAFLASDFGGTDPKLQLSLNPNFAFWDVATHDVGKATHAEVYFTISTVLHHSRRSRDGKYSLFEQPGYGHVLSPGNFDRFNDPVIQAAILRAARGAELSFAGLDELSRQMADVIAASVKNWQDSQRGAAALEFSLSLLRGITEGTGGAIRLNKEDYAIVAEAAARVDAREAPVLARTLQFMEEKRLRGV